ncbi:MAG: hypothetical protein JWP35_3918 [Caulobacter sp.]|nr:hypothetical protein [Caulobacter sp.]
MIHRNFVSGALALSVLGLAAAPAFAQDYPPPPPGYQRQGDGYYQGQGQYYDPCHRDTSQRGVGGALVGGLAGAVVGSQLAGNGHRTDGSVLGGVVGAVIGNKVGRDTAACRDGRYGDPRYGYRQGYYGAGGQYQGGYADDRYYDPRDPRDNDGDGDYDANDRYATSPAPTSYGDRDSDPNGCRLAESPVYMPDGTVQKRYVRVCPDAQGHYQVVD